MAELPSKPKPTVDAIFAYHESNQFSGYRDHLGGSILGTECERALFYAFRWSTSTKHTGRLLRLFERGQMEEARFVKALRAIGVTVLDIDPDTGRQWRLRDETGHSGGEMDGVGYGFLEAPKTWAGIEMKTHSSKSFALLVKDGVAKSKPLHWAQMHVYAELAGLDRFYYLAVNKDNDDLYSEWVHIDKALSIQLLAKAKRIIQASAPAEKISQDPTFFKCKFCDHADVCHGTAIPEAHCRSCLHSTAVEGGVWTCEAHKKVLSPEDQRRGCGHHLYLPALVHGKQIDANLEQGWVSYEMPDGSTWRDGVPF